MPDAAACAGRGVKRAWTGDAGIAAARSSAQGGGSNNRCEDRGSTAASSSGTIDSGKAARRRPRATEEALLALEEAASRYQPLARSLERLHSLRRRHRHKKARRWLEGLLGRLAGVPPGLTGRAAAVRFVALSDTHGYHRSVEVPSGEVLLFLGDMVGNYGRSCDLEGELETFLNWLSVLSKRFAKVFFIAGNHETLLDSSLGDTSAGLELLERFLQREPKLRYLQNDGAEYRGLRLWGSPVTSSRLETEGKRYYSRAFERPRSDRSSLWRRVPEGLDLLLTHGPPLGRLCSDNVGDRLLSERLAAMTSPPRYHVFGHDHLFLGVDTDSHTVFLNVAQDEALRVDERGGGCALVFDVPTKDNSASNCRA